jgi:hypothetical protein
MAADGGRSMANPRLSDGPGMSAAESVTAIRKKRRVYHFDRDLHADTGYAWTSGLTEVADNGGMALPR